MLFAWSLCDYFLFLCVGLCVGPPVKPIEPIPSASIIGGIIGGAYVVSALVVIITIVVIIIIKDKQKKKCELSHCHVVL